MNSSEKLCLTLNDFRNNLKHAFESFRNDNVLSDVTLVCEDGQQLEAHRIILASCSPLFMEIFRNTKHSHPLIYMRGVRSEDLEAILDFVYCGEANVYQENLNSFLALAEELKLKGIMVEQTINDSQNALQSKFISQKIISKGCVKVNLDIGAHTGGKVVENDKNQTTVEIGQLDQQICSLMDQTDNMIHMGGQDFRAMICKVCGKEAKKAHMKEHIEAHHIAGISHNCDLCGNIFRLRKGLKEHKRKYHI